MKKRLILGEQPSPMLFQDLNNVELAHVQVKWLEELKL